jgi:hypothetical protein
MLQIGVFITVRQNPSAESISFQSFRILPHSCMWNKFTMRLQDEGNQENVNAYVPDVLYRGNVLPDDGTFAKDAVIIKLLNNIS